MGRTYGRMGILRGHRRSIAALEVGVRGRIVEGNGVERWEWWTKLESRIIERNLQPR